MHTTIRILFLILIPTLGFSGEPVIESNSIHSFQVHSNGKTFVRLRKGIICDELLKRNYPNNLNHDFPIYKRVKTFQFIPPYNEYVVVDRSIKSTHGRSMPSVVVTSDDGGCVTSIWIHDKAWIPGFTHYFGDHSSEKIAVKLHQLFLELSQIVPL